MPSEFAINYPVLPKNGIRIIEDLNCFFKSDSMLAFIAFRFGGVPFELDHALL